MIDDNDTTNATTMMLNYSMNITNYTPHHEPSPHRPCQDPLDRTRRSLHRHRCRRRPPSPSLSATAAIATIMGLVFALRTVEYLMQSGVVNLSRRKAERDRSQTPVLGGATMYDKPVKLKAPHSEMLRYVDYEC